jgi:hypothetical protein
VTNKNKIRKKKKKIWDKIRSRDSVVGIATGYRLDVRGVRVQVPVGKEFSFLHFVQNGSGAHPTSYPMGIGGSFPGSKAAGT